MLEGAAGEAAGVWGRWAAKGAFLRPRVRAAEGVGLTVGGYAAADFTTAANGARTCAGGARSGRKELVNGLMGGIRHVGSPNASRQLRCSAVDALVAGTSQPPGNAAISAGPSTRCCMARVGCSAAAGKGKPTGPLMRTRKCRLHC